MDVQELRPKPINNAAIGPLSRNMGKVKEKEPIPRRVREPFLSKHTFMTKLYFELFFLMSCGTVLGSDVSGCESLSIT